MKRLTSFAAAACALAVTASSVPALAQYANEYVPPKVKTVGKSSHALTGKGKVVVQVQVNADGSHKVIKIISSTNSGDNAAAMDIAQSSTYTPAHRGNKPVTAFYDFALNLNGTSVSQVEEPASGGDAAIDELVRTGKYTAAIAAANDALAKNPNDQTAQQLLGVAEYYNNDLAASAAAFSKVANVSKTYSQVAAQAYAGAAAHLVQSDPGQALDYAKRGAAISANVNTRYVLGVAELANKQYPDAITQLKAVHDSPGIDVKTKSNVDGELLQAYLATNDEADADAVNKELHTIDPSSGTGGHTVAVHFLQAGVDSMKAKDFVSAVKSFDQAAAAGNSQDAVTANTYAAFAYLSMSTPNYDKAREYGLKALSNDPNSPEANYAVGESYAGTYSASQKSDDKQKAIDYLTKADTYAKAANNSALAQKAESQIKTISSVQQQ